MKEKLLSWGTLVCLFALTCLLLVHALAIFPGVPAMRWFFVTCAVALARLDAPSWVQAVGSIVAIAAAIGIALWQRRAEQTVARATARATVMVVGAAIDSKVHMLMATTTAMLHEFDHPSRPTVVERAKFFQTLFAKCEQPTEEQMLLLATAMPDAAGVLANGVAAVTRVLTGLDFVASSPSLTTLTDQEILPQYLGMKQNLATAIQHLSAARFEMNRFARMK